MTTSAQAVAIRNESHFNVETTKTGIKSENTRFSFKRKSGTTNFIVLAVLAALLSLMPLASAQQDSSTRNESAPTLETGQAPLGVVPLNTWHPVNGPSDFSGLSPSGNGIDYHGGPVMVTPHNIYYIWYGNWAGNTATSILPRFAAGLNGSRYFNTDSTYTQSDGQSVINTVTMSTQVSDNYSRGSSLADSDIAAIVNSKIVSKQLPTDPNGIYFVLTSSDVQETSGFCARQGYCGWHKHATFNGADIKYAFAGDPDQCPSLCEPGSSPNGNPGADGMASVIAHELNETVTDPDGNAWFRSFNGYEVGDLCAGSFGSTYPAPNGSLANVTLGGNYYYIQQNWVNASGGYCAMFPGEKIDQLAGPWQIALVGNTGCGVSSMLFSGTLNASGVATGTLTGSSGGCGSGSSTQTFTINSLNANGSGTASLSCGSGCGWSFDIQVAANEQTFNLVDVVNGGANVLAGTAVGQGASITIDQLAGPWQIALVGNTGCGVSSMLFSGTLNASGVATGTLTGSSGGCGSGSSTQTFTINSLNANGSGTASLSCGSGCGWSFDIEVAADKQTFNLVDVVNGGANVLAGTAVGQGASITMDQLVGPWQIALVGNTGCGRSSMLFSGTLNASGNPTSTLVATGTLTSSSGGCGSGSSTQTFTINSLNPNGSGTASLSCGSGCGWSFDIQVAANEQTFNLVDVVNGGANVLAGTAAAKPGFAIVPDLDNYSWQLATTALQDVGLNLKSSGVGEVVPHSQKPQAGTSLPVGSTVTVVLNNN